WEHGGRLTAVIGARTHEAVGRRRARQRPRIAYRRARRRFVSRRGSFAVEVSQEPATPTPPSRCDFSPKSGRRSRGARCTTNGAAPPSENIHNEETSQAPTPTHASGAPEKKLTR